MPGMAEARVTIAPFELTFSVKGTDIITPLLVPIHNLLHDIRRVVILMSENPTLPVPTIKNNKK